jgi:hypothetical protein
MNYLPVNVYGVQSDSTFLCGDSSNCGVTLTHRDKLVVPHVRGQYTEQDVKERGMVILELMEPAFPGCPPRFKPQGIAGHAMFGGRYVMGDSRFTEAYSKQPVQVHDRVE